MICWVLGKVAATVRAPNMIRMSYFVSATTNVEKLEKSVMEEIIKQAASKLVARKNTHAKTTHRNVISQAMGGGALQLLLFCQR